MKPQQQQGGVYTAIDLANAHTYARQRTKLRMIVKLRDLYNCFTFIDYSVEQADKSNHYYYPDNFAHRAIYVDVQLTKSLCEKLSCNVTKPDEVCRPTDEPRYYRVGDPDLFEVACNAPCFQLKSVQQSPSAAAATASTAIAFPRMHWHNNECVLLTQMHTYMEMPRYRANEKFVLRLNDLPTGYDRHESKITQHGISYTMNKSYCNAFFDSYDERTSSCYSSVGASIANFLVGKSFIKTCRAGITSLKNSDGSSIPVDDHLKLPMPKLEEKDTIDYWRSHTNPDFVVPNPDADVNVLAAVNNNHHRRLRREASPATHRRRRRVRLAQFVRNVNWRDMVYRYRRNGKLIINDDDIAAAATDTAANDVATATAEEVDAGATIGETMKDVPTFLTKLKSIATELLHSAADGELEKTVAEYAAFDVGKALLRDTARESIRAATKMLLSGIEATEKPISELAFKSASQYLIGRMMTQEISETLTKVMLDVDKLIVGATTGVDIVMMITMLFDMVFTFWDVAGLHSQIDSNDALDHLIYASDMANRRSIGGHTALTFAAICMRIVPKQDYQEILALEAFDFIEYLEALSVNSEGSVIDKGGRVVRTTEQSRQQLQRTVDQTVAQIHLYTPKQFEHYENDFCQRTLWLKRLQKYIISSVVAICLSILINATMAIAFSIITLIVVVCMYYVSCYGDTYRHFVDFFAINIT